MNPFVQNFKLELIQVSKSKKIIDTDDISDGIIMKYETVSKTFMIEKQHKTTVYEIPFIETVLFRNDMKSNGRDLLLYIIYNMVDNQDWINLKQDKVTKQMGNSKPTLISAISQLEDAAIICKKSQSEYWVNPFYIFKGNRIAYYNSICPECVEVVAKVTK